MRIASPPADENLLELIPEHCPDMLALLDVNGLFLYGNAAHLLHLGRSSESLIGVAIFDLIHPDDVPAFEKAITSRSVKRLPFRLNGRWLKEQGRTAQFESVGKWIPIDGGRSHHLLLSSREILAQKEETTSQAETDQFRADAVKLLTRAEREKTGVARTIHDELGQKLTAMSLEMSLWKTELDQSKKISVNSIREKLAVLGDLVNGMIGSTRTITATLRPRVLEEFGLSAALEWHLEKVEKQMGVSCAFTTDCQKLKFDAFEAAQIFRIAEEIIASCIEAGSSRLRVLLLTQEGTVALVFENANQRHCLAPDTFLRIRLLGGEVEMNNPERRIVVTLPCKMGV